LARTSGDLALDWIFSVQQL